MPIFVGEPFSAETGRTSQQGGQEFHLMVDQPLHVQTVNIRTKRVGPEQPVPEGGDNPADRVKAAAFFSKRLGHAGPPFLKAG